MGWIIGIAVVLINLFTYGIVAGSKRCRTEEEIEIELNEQAQYLKNVNQNRGNAKKEG